VVESSIFLPYIGIPIDADERYLPARQQHSDRSFLRIFDPLAVPRGLVAQGWRRPFLAVCKGRDGPVCLALRLASSQGPGRWLHPWSGDAGADEIEDGSLEDCAQRKRNRLDVIAMPVHNRIRMLLRSRT
jgi:hypothetical protein